MAYSAVLEFGDNSTQRYSKQFMLANFRLVLNRAYKVVPTGAARCERLELVVVAPDKTNLALFDWFLKRSFRSGRIVISLSGDVISSDTKNQTVYFEDARCFSLEEKYDINSMRRRLIKMSLVSDRIKIGEVTFK